MKKIFKNGNYIEIDLGLGGSPKRFTLGARFSESTESFTIVETERGDSFSIAFSDVPNWSNEQGSPYSVDSLRLFLISNTGQSGGGSGSGTSGIIDVSKTHRFLGANIAACRSARDSYFTQKPEELITNTYIVLEPTDKAPDIILERYSGIAWLDVTEAIKGEKGDKGDAGGGLIKVGFTDDPSNTAEVEFMLFNKENFNLSVEGVGQDGKAKIAIKDAGRGLYNIVGDDTGDTFTITSDFTKRYNYFNVLTRKFFDKFTIILNLPTEDYKEFILNTSDFSNSQPFLQLNGEEIQLIFGMQLILRPNIQTGQWEFYITRIPFYVYDDPRYLNGTHEIWDIEGGNRTAAVSRGILTNWIPEINDKRGMVMGQLMGLKSTGTTSDQQGRTFFHNILLDDGTSYHFVRTGNGDNMKDQKLKQIFIDPKEGFKLNHEGVISGTLRDGTEVNLVKTAANAPNLLFGDTKASVVLETKDGNAYISDGLEVKKILVEGDSPSGHDPSKGFTLEDNTSIKVKNNTHGDVNALNSDGYGNLFIGNSFIDSVVNVKDDLYVKKGSNTPKKVLVEGDTPSGSSREDKIIITDFTISSTDEFLKIDELYVNAIGQPVNLTINISDSEMDKIISSRGYATLKLENVVDSNEYCNVIVNGSTVANLEPAASVLLYYDPNGRPNVWSTRKIIAPIIELDAGMADFSSNGWNFFGGIKTYIISKTTISNVNSSVDGKEATCIVEVKEDNFSADSKFCIHKLTLVSSDKSVDNKQFIRTAPSRSLINSAEFKPLDYDQQPDNGGFDNLDTYIMSDSHPIGMYYINGYTSNSGLPDKIPTTERVGVLQKMGIVQGTEIAMFTTGTRSYITFKDIAGSWQRWLQTGGTVFDSDVTLGENVDINGLDKNGQKITIAGVQDEGGLTGDVVAFSSPLHETWVYSKDRDSLFAIVGGVKAKILLEGDTPVSDFIIDKDNPLEVKANDGSKHDAIAINSSDDLVIGTRSETVKSLHLATGATEIGVYRKDATTGQEIVDRVVMASELDQFKGLDDYFVEAGKVDNQIMKGTHPETGKEIFAGVDDVFMWKYSNYTYMMPLSFVARKGSVSIQAGRIVHNTQTNTFTLNAASAGGEVTDLGYTIGGGASAVKGDETIPITYNNILTSPNELAAGTYPFTGASKADLFTFQWDKNTADTVTVPLALVPDGGNYIIGGTSNRIKLINTAAGYELKAGSSISSVGFMGYTVGYNQGSNNVSVNRSRQKSTLYLRGAEYSITEDDIQKDIFIQAEPFVADSYGHYSLTLNFPTIDVFKKYYYIPTLNEGQKNILPHIMNLNIQVWLDPEEGRSDKEHRVYLRSHGDSIAWETSTKIGDPIGAFIHRPPNDNTRSILYSFNFMKIHESASIIGNMGGYTAQTAEADNVFSLDVTPPSSSPINPDNSNIIEFDNNYYQQIDRIYPVEALETMTAGQLVYMLESELIPAFFPKVKKVNPSDRYATGIIMKDLASGDNGLSITSGTISIGEDQTDLDFIEGYDPLEEWVENRKIYVNSLGKLSFIPSRHEIGWTLADNSGMEQKNVILDIDIYNASVNGISNSDSNTDLDGKIVYFGDDLGETVKGSTLKNADLLNMHHDIDTNKVSITSINSEIDDVKTSIISNSDNVSNLDEKIEKSSNFNVLKQIVDRSRIGANNTALADNMGNREAQALIFHEKSIDDDGVSKSYKILENVQISFDMYGFLPSDKGGYLIVENNHDATSILTHTLFKFYDNDGNSWESQIYNDKKFSNWFSLSNDVQIANSIDDLNLSHSTLESIRGQKEKIADYLITGNVNGNRNWKLRIYTEDDFYDLVDYWESIGLLEIESVLVNNYDENNNFIGKVQKLLFNFYQDERVNPEGNITQNPFKITSSWTANQKLFYWSNPMNEIKELKSLIQDLQLRVNASYIEQTLTYENNLLTSTMLRNDNLQHTSSVIIQGGGGEAPVPENFNVYMGWSQTYLIQPNEILDGDLQKGRVTLSSSKSSLLSDSFSSTRTEEGYLYSYIAYPKGAVSPDPSKVDYNGNPATWNKHEVTINDLVYVVLQPEYANDVTDITITLVQ